MCVISMIHDHYNDKWRETYPWYPNIPDPNSSQAPNFYQNISKEEFDELKKDVQEMKELMKKALQYDIDNDQKDCGVLDKMVKIKKVADIVGISLDEIYELSEVYKQLKKIPGNISNEQNNG